MYAYFNYIHIIYLLLPIIFTIALYYAFRDRSPKVQRIVLIVLWCFTMSISITDLIKGGIAGGWKGVLKVLPLFACDLNNFILPIVLFGKKRHPIIDKYVAYFVLTGPLFTLLSPPVANYTHYFYEYPVWSSYLGHGTYITIALLYFLFFKPKISSRKPWQMWCMIHGLMLGVHCINLLLIHTGLNPDANYFFTIAGFPLFAAWRAMVSLGYHIPYVYSFFFMTVGYTAMTIFFYFVHKVTETELFAKFVARLKEEKNKFFSKIKDLYPKKKRTPVLEGEASRGTSEETLPEKQEESAQESTEEKPEE